MDLVFFVSVCYLLVRIDLVNLEWTGFNILMFRLRVVAFEILGGKSASLNRSLSSIPNRVPALKNRRILLEFRTFVKQK